MDGCVINRNAALGHHLLKIATSSMRDLEKLRWS
jgi:hypothetical protein